LYGVPPTLDHEIRIVGETKFGARVYKVYYCKQSKILLLSKKLKLHHLSIGTAVPDCHITQKWNQQSLAH
jgi:hypothetical protein